MVFSPLAGSLELRVILQCTGRGVHLEAGGEVGGGGRDRRGEGPGYLRGTAIEIRRCFNVP